MSRRNRWFNRVVKVVASVAAFLTCAGHLVETVEGGVSHQNQHGSNSIKEHQKQSYHKSDGGIEASFSQQNLRTGVDSPQPFSLQKPHVDSNCDVFYIIVSTIDGKVSALDLHKKGSLVWSVEADARPLYSSSLANMEMIHDGKKMRLIPSLDGALYQFDGDKVEAIPVSAETLLSSTYKLGDDSMIVGSKDLRNFGVNLHSGKVQFTCGSEGCTNFEGKTENKVFDGSSTIVITRSTQVVRSVDIKNGNEKWNFSVGQHQVSLPTASKPSDENDGDDGAHKRHNIPVFSSYSDECQGEENYTEDIGYENLLQLLVPEGRVVALNKGDFTQVSWEHKFDSPIAKAWFLRHGKLKTVNLFDGQLIPSLRSYAPDDTENMSTSPPLLYIGSHQKLLYIQASPQLETILKTFANHRVGHYIDPKVKVSWRPYPNTANTPIMGGKRPQVIQDEKPGTSDTKESTSLTVWHEDYPFDTGYFLYPEITDTRSVSQKTVGFLDSVQENAEEEEAWLPVSLWMYWKEVVFISLTVSIVVHIMLTKYLRPTDSACKLSAEALTDDISKNSNSSHPMIISDSTSLFRDKLSFSGEYVSRFEADFDCLHCLGKGGFGIVFEAVNKVDEQHYAVKRTTLPRSEGAKEKVLREVKALAKLEHIGIVRYFNAWVESPPAGWQEERDKLFLSSDTSGPTSFSTTTDHYQPNKKLPPSNIKVGDKKLKYNVDSGLLFPASRGEILLDTDSIIFSSKAASADDQLRHSGSGEFSVHPDFKEFSETSETEFTHSGHSLLSFDVIAMFDARDFDTASVHDSRSSIPFSNYTSSSSGIRSHKADSSYNCQEFSGDSVVFESTDNKASDCSTAFVKTDNSAEDSVVFEASQVTTSEKRSNQRLSLSDQDHHTIDITLSSHVSGHTSDTSKEQVATLPGNKLFLYIQMQLYRKETLKDWLSSNTLNRDRHTVLDIFDQIVCAVDYVHSQGLMHRDLKPSNIFFTADGIVKVGDFGLVTELIGQQDQQVEIDDSSFGKHTAEVGTTLYMSPEQIARKPYDLKVDIFSLGLIFLELWIPFSTQMERVRTLQDAKRQIFPARFNRELPVESELVHKMTSPDPAARPFTKDILDHPLFHEFAPTRIGARKHKRTFYNS